MLLSDTISRLGRSLCGRIAAETPLRLPSLPAAAEAMLVWALAAVGRRPVVWVRAGHESLASGHQDLISLLAAAEAAMDVFFYPAWESLPGPAARPDPDITGQRLCLLLRLCNPKGPFVVVTSAQALMQRTLSPLAVTARTVRIASGDLAEPAAIAGRMSAAGYSFAPAVEEKGQAARRGGLLDVWPLTEDWPLRIEFNGEAIDSIREFDPMTQRSVGRRPAADITPACEFAPGDGHGSSESPAASLPSDAIVVWSDPEVLAVEAAAHEALAAESRAMDSVISFAALQEIISGRVAAQALAGGAYDGTPSDPVWDFRPLPGAAASAEMDLGVPDVMERNRRQLHAEFLAHASAGRQVYLFFDTQGALDRYRESHDDGITTLCMRVGPLSSGFASETYDLVAASESDIYGRRRVLRGRYDPNGRRKRPEAGAGSDPLQFPADLEPDDLVVHIQHGIGRYVGMNTISFDGSEQEVLTIEYAEGGILHVPVSQMHLLTRYVGVGNASVALHKLGARRWREETAAAQKAVDDLAASLLETQAMRNSLPGHAFRTDTPWQHEFEAAFPYRETADQERTIREVLADMQSGRPMDRLVCGDVGFGKTEIAMRAAFKAVMEGSQVAVLVPTTVLCQQHFCTFAERMAAYPVRIEMLSRLCPAPARKAILHDLARGHVDIVIGTHCLLQGDVRVPNLGLVIIDEEQRFGVRHKEKLKHMRRLVDVLTMTATPIPRTLYMSLTGLKDLSTVQTPPQHRLPIETIASRHSDELIRSAVMREIGRQGQVYYLHNRVLSIDRVREKLARLVPEARIAVAHGRMTPAELGRVMKEFVRAEHDVLLCTTIIESGLDIPNVNTIIVDRADRFGMADLYQLRGRVGRSTNKAYAILLLPAAGALDPAARRRVETLSRYTSLGSGFKLALRDLELRGAGNLLGSEQSGHAGAIGFTLYCQLLKRSVTRLQGLPAPRFVDVDLRLGFVSLSPSSATAADGAVIPSGYIPDEPQRLGIYRRLAQATEQRDLDEMRGELRDRYGPLPPTAERLLKLAELRVLAALRGLDTIEVAEDVLRLRRAGAWVQKDSMFPRLKGRTADERISEIRHFVARLRS